MALGPNDLVLCSGTVARQTPLRDRLGAASAAGFGGISLWGRDYRAAREEGFDDSEIASLIADHGLAVAELDPAWWWTPGAAAVHIPPEADPVDVFRYGEDEVLRIAEVLGARSINAVDVLGGSYGPAEAAEGFARLCDRAADHGLLVHLEWLAWSKIPDLATARAIVDMAERPNGGLTVDVWHCVRTDTAPAEIATLPGRLVASIQLSDGPAQPEPELVTATLHHRQLPGHGEFDLAGYLRALRSTGTEAPVGVEIFSDDLHRLGATEAARRAAEATRAVLEAARSPA